MITFKNDRTARVTELARTAAQAGSYQRSVDLLAEADGLEAWAGVPCGGESRAAIAATIRSIRQAERRTATV
jgi:hypothetical protein